MGESVGAINVGLKARTKAFSAGMQNARRDLQQFGKQAQRTSQDAGRSIQTMGERFRKNGETVKFGAQQATVGLLQFTDQAGAAGRAATGLSASLQGLFTGGLVGLGVAAVTSVFALLAEESRKAKEEQEKAAEKARQEQERLVEKTVQAASSARDRVVQIRRDREEQEYQLALDRMEREAQARGEFFDRAMHQELRASKERRRELRQLLGDELGGVAELEQARAKATAEQRQQLDEALRQRRANVEALREEIRLESSRPQQTRDASAGRERARQAAELKRAQDQVVERIQAEAKERSDAAVALRRQVQQQLELANMTEEERRNAGLVRMIREAEARGLKDLAEKARELLQYEQDRAKWAKDSAAAKAKEAQGQRVDRQLAQREKLADARTEKEREVVRLQAEYQQLLEAGASRHQALNTLRAEAFRRAREQKQEQNEVVQALERQLEVAKAATDQERQRIQRAQELAAIQEKGGQKAVELQQQLNKLKDEQAKKDQAAARAAREASGEMGVALGAGKYRIRADGTMDKGLASSRQARRNANRMRKYQRQQRARESMGRSIHDGQFSGLGGIRSGRRTDQQGAFSDWYTPRRDDDTTRDGGQFRGGPKGPPKLGPDGKPVGDGPPGPPKPMEPVVTGKPGEGAKGSGPDFAKVVEDARKAAEDLAAEQARATEAQTAANEATTKAKDSAKEAADAAEDQAKATDEQQQELKRLAEATKGVGQGMANAMKATTTQVQQLTREQEKLRQDLELLAKTVSGAG